MAFVHIDNLVHLEPILYRLVLVPGFEPGSTDRESVMMDRTTLHELANRSAGQKFMKSTLISRNYHFHFHLDHSFGHSYAESDCYEP